MNPLAVALKPINHGWAVALTDRREVARFTGSRKTPGAALPGQPARTPLVTREATPVQLRRGG